jgi:signal recognition particle GTPase
VDANNPYMAKVACKLLVSFIGVGEALDDLQPFDADTFVESLFA